MEFVYYRRSHHMNLFAIDAYIMMLIPALKIDSRYSGKALKLTRIPSHHTIE